MVVTMEEKKRTFDFAPTDYVSVQDVKDYFNVSESVARSIIIENMVYIRVGRKSKKILENSTGRGVAIRVRWQEVLKYEQERTIQPGTLPDDEEEGEEE